MIASSSLHQFAPQFVLFSISARDTIAGVPLSATTAEVDETIGRSVDEFAYCGGRRDDFHATIIQQTFLDITEPVFGSYDSAGSWSACAGDHAAQRSTIERLPHRMACYSSTSPVPVSATESMRGLMRVAGYHGKLEIAPEAAILYGDMVARIVAAATRAIEKMPCLRSRQHPLGRRDR